MSKASPPPPQHKRLGRARPDHARRETRFSGIPVSAGVAIGPVFRASEPAPKITRHKIQASDSAAEGARFEAAIAQSRKQLNKLRDRLVVLPEESQVELAPLIDAYIRMLGSSRMIRGSAPAHRGDPGFGRDRRGRRGRGDRRRNPGAGRTRDARRRPSRPDAARR